MKKKLLMLALTLALAFGMVACGDKDDDDKAVNEETNESKTESDIQLCDTIRSAFTTTLLDPDMYMLPDFNPEAFNGVHTLKDNLEYNATFAKYFYDIMGCSSVDEIEAQLKSPDALGNVVYVEVLNGNQVTVWVEKTSIAVGPNADAHKL